MPPDIIEWLPRSATLGAILLVSGWLTFVRLCEDYEKVANALGPLGRRIRRRHQQSVRATLKVQDDYAALLTRISMLEKMVRTIGREAADRERKFEIKIKKLELVEEVHAAHQDMTAEYLREDAQWHINQGTLAIEKEFEMLPHRTFTVFCLDYRRRHGMGPSNGRSDDP